MIPMSDSENESSEILSSSSAVLLVDFFVLFG